MNDRKEKLGGLGADVLADALLALADHDDMAAAQVERLLAPAGNTLARITARLKQLYKGGRHYDWRSSRELAANLHLILHDISSSDPDPDMGVKLMLRFYEADAGIFECCDDSSGEVGDIYRNEAPRLFAQYAKDVSDKAGLVASIKKLISNDEYGVREHLVGRAYEWLDASSMRALAAYGMEQALAENDRYRRFRWSSLAESMARCLNDASLFEYIRRRTSDTMGAAAWTDLAEAHLAEGNHARALEMLEQVPEDDWFQLGRRDEIRLKLFQQTGRDSDAHAVAWKIFNQSRSMAALESLLGVIGNAKRQEVIAQEVERIRTTSTFSEISADFLIQTGNVAECAGYVERHAAQIDGRNYYFLPKLARTLQSHEHLLAATLVFRALLWSLLDRGVAKAYQHGAQYLRLLTKMAPTIADWKTVEKHDLFYQALQARHGRKRSFWIHVDDEPPRQ